MAGRIVVDEDKFKQLWLSDMSVARISAELRISTDSLNRVRVRLGLPARTPKTRAKPGEPYRDPTPSEIEERAAAVRATWSAETEEKRRVTKSIIRPYEFPVVSVRDIDDAVAGGF